MKLFSVIDMAYLISGQGQITLTVQIGALIRDHGPVRGPN